MFEARARVEAALDVFRRTKFSPPEESEVSASAGTASMMYRLLQSSEPYLCGDPVGV